MENISTLFTFGQTELLFLINLALVFILGALIGAEREWRGKDAGMSTHTFVIAGAMLFTFLSATVDEGSKTRIAAQIVSGIGFLGAGLILKEGLTVKNLTTAASIWFAGALGMAIGFGYHTIAIMSAIASLIIPHLPHVQDYKDPKDRRGNAAQESSAYNASIDGE